MSVDWTWRAKAVSLQQRCWATPDVWAARRAAVRSIDAKMTRGFFATTGRVPEGWDCSDYMQLVSQENPQ